jgi:hypothetical protein
MSKKRISNSEKRLRREVELLRAQVRQESPINLKPVMQEVKNETSPKVKSEKTERYELPIVTIKKDLIKTFLYACFAIGMLTVLNVTKVSL